MSEMTMVERVSRAMCSAEGLDPDMPATLGSEIRVWETRKRTARAAILSLVEPTDAMRKAGFLANQYRNPHTCDRLTCIARITMPADNAWRAMVGAILHEDVDRV